MTVSAGVPSPSIAPVEVNRLRLPDPAVCESEAADSFGINEAAAANTPENTPKNGGLNLTPSAE